jgi:hypothetical protein
MQPENRTWDPGGVQEDQEERNQLFKINVPKHIYSLMSMATVLAADVFEENGDEEELRTELDSHANRPVAGRNAYIISDKGRLADVNPFTPDYNSMLMSIVDAAVRYDCPYDGQTHMLVAGNALLVPSMRNNLMPPFVMREAGIKVNNAPKTQTTEPTKKDHSMYFPETTFRIPLSL